MKMTLFKDLKYLRILLIMPPISNVSDEKTFSSFNGMKTYLYLIAQLDSRLFWAQ